MPDYRELKRLAESALSKLGPFDPNFCLPDSEVKFSAAASPAVVLAMLAKNEALAEALKLTVQSLDQLLPYLAKVPADIGLLNDALIAGRAALAQQEVGNE